jgi:hypothetical protein
LRRACDEIDGSAENREDQHASVDFGTKDSF